jgi:hypothetical protein
MQYRNAYASSDPFCYTNADTNSHYITDTIHYRNAYASIVTYSRSHCFSVAICNVRSVTTTS